MGQDLGSSRLVELEAVAPFKLREASRIVPIPAPELIRPEPPLAPLVECRPPIAPDP